MIVLNMKRTKDVKVRTKFSLRGLQVFGVSNSLPNWRSDGDIFSQ